VNLLPAASLVAYFMLIPFPGSQICDLPVGFSYKLSTHSWLSHKIRMQQWW